MALEGFHIAVVIPCYRVREQILPLLERIPDFVDKIYCVDDACPDGSGDLIESAVKQKRVILLRNPDNKGVGGAVIKGYEQAIEDGMDIAVKLDGDGQMDPALIRHFITPIIAGTCDYTKGNRFFRIKDVKSMPGMRLFGNAALSFFSKLSSGYWQIFDPANGYTAVHTVILRNIPLEHVRRRFFFESDMLYQLGSLRCVVKDIPMKALYGEEESSLRISKIFLPFLWGHIRNAGKRIFYNYILRDFNLASIELILGIILLAFGLVFGLSQWGHSLATNEPATAGTVMLSALPLIISVQFILSFLNYDIQNTPRESKWPIFQTLLDSKNE